MFLFPPTRSALVCITLHRSTGLRFHGTSFKASDGRPLFYKRSLGLTSRLPKWAADGLDAKLLIQLDVPGRNSFSNVRVRFSISVT
ncbi:hypothetical protein DFH06DRAFT_1308446 [Mycena polygramma]|nr:hypothetical protein DFH06DRAFT_1308446 [Mycena polygramma]